MNTNKQQNKKRNKTEEMKQQKITNKHENGTDKTRKNR